MKLTKSKQFLADAIHASGKGWPDGANWAAQDREHAGMRNNLCFYSSGERPGKPSKNSGFWRGNGVGDKFIQLNKLLPNWHQTVLSREEYFSAYQAELASEPVADADGWIEWNGGECPVEKGTLVDVKYANGLINFGVSAMTNKLDKNHVQGTAVSFYASNWDERLPISGIVAYRLHRQAVGAEPCESTARSIPEPATKPTIEQLAADYRNKLDYANRKQQEADDAKAAADAALGELKLAGEALGLVIGIAKPEPELVITDWRELMIGDEISTKDGTVVTVTGFNPSDNNWPVMAMSKDGDDWGIGEDGFKFIRRP